MKKTYGEKAQNRSASIINMQVETEYDMTEEELFEMYVDWFGNGLKYWKENIE